MDNFSTANLEKIRTLVVEGDTEAAVKLLAQATKNERLERFHHLALSLNSRINKLEDKILKRIISQEDEEICWNQITDSLLDLLAQLEDHLETQKAAPAALFKKPPPSEALEFSAEPAFVAQNFTAAPVATASANAGRWQKMPFVFLSLGALVVVAAIALLTFQSGS